MEQIENLDEFAFNVDVLPPVLIQESVFSDGTTLTSEFFIVHCERASLTDAKTPYEIVVAFEGFVGDSMNLHDLDVAIKLLVSTREYLVNSARWNRARVNN